MKSIFTLSVLSIVTALSLSACGKKDQPETPTTALPLATESTPIDPAAPVDAKVSTQDIGAAYGSNAKEAEKKFKGKKLEIVGTIADIRTDGISDLPEVILKLEQANKGVQPRVTFADRGSSCTRCPHARAMDRPRALAQASVETRGHCQNQDASSCFGGHRAAFCPAPLYRPQRSVWRQH